MINLEELCLDTKIRKRVSDFSELIINNNSDNIKAIYLYGSCDVIKVWVVLDKPVDMNFFKLNHKIVKKFEAKKIVPLFLSTNHIETSQDVFPLEFLEMKNTANLIYGEDILGTININLQNLRLQCEQQIKGLLIRYYQILLEIGDNKRKIRAMLNNSLENVFSILSGIIMLKEDLYLSDKSEILNNLNKHFDIDVDILKEILAAYKNKQFYSSDKLDEFIKKLQEIAYIVDGIKI